MRPSQKLNTFSSMIFLMKKNDILHKNSDKYALSSEESEVVVGGVGPIKRPRSIAVVTVTDLIISPFPAGNGSQG